MCSISTSPNHSSSYSSYSLTNPSKRPTGVASPSFPRWLSVIPYLADHFPPWARRNPHLLAEQQSSHGMVTLLIICSMSFLGPKKTPIVEYQEIDGDVRYICFCWGFGDGDPMVLSKKSVGSSKLFFRQIRVEAFHFYRHFTVLQQGKNGTTFKRAGATKPAADGCLHSVNWAICKASWNTCKYIEYIRKYMYMCACEKVYIYIYILISQKLWIHQGKS